MLEEQPIQEKPLPARALAFLKRHYVLVLALLPWLVLLVWWQTAPASSGVIAPKAIRNSQGWVLAQVPDLPDSLSFAGETVALNDPDVIERYERELLGNLYYQSSTLLLIKRAHRWFPVIEPILKEYGLPDDIKYVVAAESGFENRSSHRGAAGFWQLMPVSGKEFGLEVTDEVDERFHLVKATHAACKYFRRTTKHLGNYTSALASYNMGPAAFIAVMKRQGMHSYYDLLLNAETSRYVLRILALKALLADPKAFGYHLKDEQLYQPFKLRSIRVTESIGDLAAWAIAQGSNYKMLKYHNPWLLKPYLTVAPGRSFVIELPEKTSLNGNAETDANVDTTLLAPSDTVTPSLPETGPERPDPGANPDSALERERSQPGNSGATGKAGQPGRTDAPKAEPGRSNSGKNERTEERHTGKSQDRKSTRKEAAAKARTAEKPRTHTVKNGESLSVIAARHNMSQQQLARLNGIKVNARLRKGQTLKLR